MISKAIVGEFAKLPLLVNSNRVDNDNGNIVLGQFSPARSVSNNNNNDDSKATVLIK